MGFLWFVLGLVIGAAGIWVLLSRKSDERVAEIERSFEVKLQHAQDDAFQADRAHHETKERLIAAQLEHVALEKRLAVPAEVRAPAPLPAKAPPVAAPKAPTSTTANASAPGPAKAVVAAAPAVPPVPPRSQPSQRQKAIEAKLAQLPAGSSARAALLREQQELRRGAPSTPKAAAAVPTATATVPPAATTVPPAATTVPPAATNVPPAAMAAGGAPGLRRIKGIGPSLERRLKDLGVRTMQDLAALDEAGVARIDEALDFKGRVARERWVEQARELLRS